MIDARIYRAAFLPAVAAFVALMFSVEPAPEPIQGPVSTPSFQGRSTAALTRTIAKQEAGRPPGSEGDRALAERVRRSFGQIEGGEVAGQTFEGNFDGEDVELENVLLTLPGQRGEVLLVVAGRASPTGQGATTSAASTAVLLQMAADLGSSRHERTIVLASIPGAGSGSSSSGVRELTESLEAPAGIDAAITVAQPGVPEREPPFVVAGHAEPSSIPVALQETAVAIASVRFGTDADPAGGWQQFARLALPTGVGDATALAAEEITAVTISGSGERPPPAADTSPESLTTRTIVAVGGTALDLLLTLDERDAALDSGPSAYVQIGDNLLPGWTLQLLALALVLPALLTAADAWLRDRRRSPRTARRALPWALERALLPLVALLLAYALSIVGLIPDPAFPFDPGRFPLGGRGVVAAAVIGLAVLGAGLLIRPLRTPLDAEAQTLAAAAGMLCGAALVAIWLLNPFMALLLAPIAHVWLLPARAQGPPRPAIVAIAAALTLIPIALAASSVAASLELGGQDALWYLLLLVVDGQVGLLMALAWCLLLGGLLACIGAAAVRSAVVPSPVGAGSVRGPGGHAGPGSLGGTSSTLGARSVRLGEGGHLADPRSLR